MSEITGTSKKISELVGQTTLDDAADLVISTPSGESRKIAFGDLKTEVGAIGTLAQEGDPLGTPILDITGTDNKIRNVEPQAGITAAVSPLNGIEIGHDFLANGTGVPLFINAQTTPQIVSAIAGAGMNIATPSPGVVQFTATGITTASNVVIVNQMSDFPAAVSGVRTLAADTGYLVSANLSTSDIFVMGSKTIVFGSDRFVSSITYTGTDAMFTAVDVSSHIKDLTMTCATGKLFDISSTIAGDLFLFDNNTIESCDEFGSMTGVTGTRLSNLTVRDVKTAGIDFTGTNGVVLVNGLLGTVNGGNLFDLGTATFDGFSCISCFTTLDASSFFISGTTASGNITAGNLGSVDNCRFFGAGTPLENISTNDARWQFTANDDIPDTRPDGLLSMQGNSTETVIAVAGTPVLIAGTWVVESVSQMTGSTAGRLTYDGEKDAMLPVTSSVTVSPVSGVNIGLSAEVAVNGTVVPGSKRSAAASSTGSASITIPWQNNFSATDYVEIFVTNEDTTANVLVSSAVHRVN